MSDTRPYHNPASQAERREEVLKDTYRSRAEADASLGSQGRYRKETEVRITGTPSYPPQPPSSFWAKSLDEVSGIEPPFGVDLNSQEAVGTPREIEESILRRESKSEKEPPP